MERLKVYRVDLRAAWQPELLLEPGTRVPGFMFRAALAVDGVSPQPAGGDPDVAGQVVGQVPASGGDRPFKPVAARADTNGQCDEVLTLVALDHGQDRLGGGLAASRVGGQDLVAGL